MPETLPRRQDVPEDKKWSVKSVFPDTEAWEAEYRRVDSLFPDLAAYQGHLGESASALAAALARRDEIGMAARKVSLYASMQRAGDTGDQAAAALGEPGGGPVRPLRRCASFYEPEILQVPPEQLAAVGERKRRAGCLRPLLGQAEPAAGPCALGRSRSAAGTGV